MASSETTTAPARAELEHPWLAANLLAQMAFGLLAMTVCLPSVQEWGEIFGAGPATVQFTFGGFLLTYGAMQFVYGPLSDRHGRRGPLLIGLAVACLASVAAALAATIETLIAARVLQGAGCAACLVVGRATVQDAFHGAARTRMMAYVGMAMGLCPPLGTVIGGQLHVRLGWASNFVLMAVLAALLMVAAWRGLPARRTAVPVQSHWLRDMGQAYARLAGERVFLLNAGVMSLASSAFYVFLSAAPLILKTYGVGPDRVGWFIMLTPLSYIVGNFLASRLAVRRGDAFLRLSGQGFSLTSIVLMLLLAFGAVKSPFAFSLPLMLLGFGHGLLMPPTLAATVGVVPALAGAAAAVAGVVQQMLGAFAGLSVGWVSLETPVPVGLLMLGFTLGSALCQWRLLRR